MSRLLAIERAFSFRDREVARRVYVTAGLGGRVKRQASGIRFLRSVSFRWFRAVGRLLWRWHSGIRADRTHFPARPQVPSRVRTAHSDSA
jgi:hypothetical protein